MPPSVDDDLNGPFAGLAELAEAFNGLVRALVEDGELAAMSPRRILDLAVECMPAGKHAALIVVQDGKARSIAATTDLPVRVDEIRIATGEGPSLDVLDTNDLVVSNDLAADPRWPLFGSRVVEELGVRSIVSYRLYLSRRHRAALSFYSDWPHAFDDLAITTGAIFAAYCSLAMHNELVLQEPVAQRRAMEVHREIGVAVGILMATGDLTTTAAYERLHRASRHLQRSLSDVAREVIAQGHLAEPPDADRPPDR
jgi:ANTAR domain/GAF domain